MALRSPGFELYLPMDQHKAQPWSLVFTREAPRLQGGQCSGSCARAGILSQKSEIRLSPSLCNQKNVKVHVHLFFSLVILGTSLSLWGLSFLLYKMEITRVSTIKGHCVDTREQPRVRYRWALSKWMLLLDLICGRPLHSSDTSPHPRSCSRVLSLLGATL